jgi:hypothetical protein
MDPFVGVLDLGPHLDEMQTGTVNVQINDDTAADWALYAVTVAKPVASAVGPSVYLDGGGSTTVGDPVAPVALLQNGGAGSGRLQISDDGALNVQGDYGQAANGSLAVVLAENMLGGTLLDIGGMAQLAGVLEIELAPGYVAEAGDTIEILHAAAGIDGEFDDVQLDELPSGLMWNLLAGDNSISLEIAAAVLFGDFNNDGIVDAVAYTVWRNNFGDTTEDDINNAGNGIDGVDLGDYEVWKAHYGEEFALGQGGLTLAVPEPSGIALAFLFLAGSCFVRVGARK